MSTWFITGAARGLGAEITKTALARGHRVAAAARNARQVRDTFPDAGEALLPVELDVTSPDQVIAAVAAAVEHFGGIDVLVNNAGRGLLSAVEEGIDHEVRSLYDVNVFGLLDVTRAVLPIMRAARTGTIVNLSSIGGFVSSPGWGLYCSTKFAVEGITEALREEVAPLGITAGLVEPGYFRTDFLDATSLHVASTIADYDDTAAGHMRLIAAEVNHQQPGDPAKAGPVIVDAVDGGAFPLRLFLGSDTIAGITTKVGEVSAELSRQGAVAVSTDHA